MIYRFFESHNTSEDDYLAVGGTLGEEKTPVRIGEEAYNKAVQTFEYSWSEEPYQSTSIDVWEPQNAFNDVSKLVG